MNANKQDAGGLPALAAQWGESAKRLVKTGVEYDNGKAAALHHCAAAIRRLCRAAPAGGGVERFSPDCEPCSDFESWVGCMRPDPNGQWVRYAPAGSGEVEELVHEWRAHAAKDHIPVPVAAAFDACANLLEAAILRKLQQGAE